VTAADGLDDPGPNGEGDDNRRVLFALQAVALIGGNEQNIALNQIAFFIVEMQAHCPVLDPHQFMEVLGVQLWRAACIEFGAAEDKRLIWGEGAV